LQLRSDLVEGYLFAKGEQDFYNLSLAFCEESRKAWWHGQSHSLSKKSFKTITCFLDFGSTLSKVTLSSHVRSLDFKPYFGTVAPTAWSMVSPKNHRLAAW